jgi:hypothetical protein
VEKEGSSSSSMDAERSEAPTSSPKQRARGESKEGNRGVGSVPRGGRKTGERGAQARHGSADHGVRMAPKGTIGGGSSRSQQRHAGEQGRAVRRGRRSAARLTGEAGRQQGPVSAVGCRRERCK